MQLGWNWQTIQLQQNATFAWAVEQGLQLFAAKFIGLAHIARYHDARLSRMVCYPPKAVRAIDHRTTRDECQAP